MSMPVAIGGHQNRVVRSDKLSGATALRNASMPNTGANAGGSGGSVVDATRGAASAITGLSAALGRLGLGGDDAMGDGVGSTMKPNLDALNRVLNHYAAQSAAADTIVSLVKA